MVLLVDDDPSMLEVSRHVLEDAGFEVRTALNGTEALRTARQQPPECIVTDLIMPGDDGLSLLRRLDDDATLCQIPRIIVTGYCNKDRLQSNYEVTTDVLRHMGSGIVLEKPVAAEALVAAVKRVVNP